VRQPPSDPDRAAFWRHTWQTSRCHTLNLIDVIRRFYWTLALSYLPEDRTATAWAL